MLPVKQISTEHEYIIVPVKTNRNAIVSSIRTHLDEQNKTLTFYSSRNEVIDMLLHFEQSREARNAVILQNLREVDEEGKWVCDESEENAHKRSAYQVFYVLPKEEVVMYYDFSFTQWVVPIKLKTQE